MSDWVQEVWLCWRKKLVLQEVNLMLMYLSCKMSHLFFSPNFTFAHMPCNCKACTSTKQLYNTVTVPRFTYGVEVWYTPLHRPEGAKNTRGSVSITAKLRSVQRKVAKAIMGGLSTTAGDVLDVHSYILPVDLLFTKLLTRAALRLCSLPKSHPLNPVTRSSAHRKAKRHRSPLHLTRLRLILRLEHSTSKRRKVDQYSDPNCDIPVKM